MGDKVPHGLVDEPAALARINQSANHLNGGLRQNNVNAFVHKNNWQPARIHIIDTLFVLLSRALNPPRTPPPSPGRGGPHHPLLEASHKTGCEAPASTHPATHPAYTTAAAPYSTPRTALSSPPFCKSPSPATAPRTRHTRPRPT